jgi:hypothetical protein
MFPSPVFYAVKVILQLPFFVEMTPFVSIQITVATGKKILFIKLLILHLFLRTQGAEKACREEVKIAFSIFSLVGIIPSGPENY